VKKALGEGLPLFTELPRRVVSMLNFATIRPRKRLDAFGPPLARLKHDPPGSNLIDMGYLHLPLIERARLVRRIQTLGLEGLRLCHMLHLSLCPALPVRQYVWPQLASVATATNNSTMCLAYYSF
jgi:hypothetical protein